MEEKLEAYFEKDEIELKEIKAKIKRLQVIPGIGKCLAQELIDMGYNDIKDLHGEDPNKMYNKLSSMRGQKIDRCVLYVFRCAVYFVNNQIHDPELLKWWNWKD